MNSKGDSYANYSGGKKTDQDPNKSGNRNLGAREIACLLPLQQRYERPGGFRRFEIPISKRCRIHTLV
jgi:hypothetical protein